MKKKTIKEVIRKKVDEWLASIEDEGLRESLGKNVIVTGGCIASMLLGEKVNDFDVYFRNHDIALAVAKYYMDRFNPKNKNGIPCAITIMDALDRVKIVVKSAGIASENGTTKAYEYFEAQGADEPAGYVGEVMQDAGEIEDLNEELEVKAQEREEDAAKPKYRPVFVSTNTISLSQKVQLVLRFFGEPEEIHKNYDYVHCMNYWKSWDDELVLKPEALECLLARELRYAGSKYPVCSLFRLRKFLKRGWSINAGHILKMCMQISELDLSNVEVLQDQLTGVDCAYFAEVIGQLKERAEENGSVEKITSVYLVEIVDRMFQ